MGCYAEGYGIMDIVEKIDILLEAKFKKVIRKGKLVKKTICPKGFKAVGGKCKKMSPAEIRKRKKSAKRAQKKIQAGGKSAILLRKRAKSMRKRDAMIPMQKPPELKTS